MYRVDIAAMSGVADARQTQAMLQVMIYFMC